MGEREIGFVYFVGTRRGEPVKIGWATNPDRRLGELQIGNPYSLAILARQAGTEEDERALHRQFKEHRLSGEWFAWNEDLAAHIRRTQPPGRMTLQDVAEWLRMRPALVWREVRQGRLPGIMVAGQLQFEAEAVEAWAAELGIYGEAGRDRRWIRTA